MSEAARPALFLDRDGVLNVDVDYAYRADQIEWMAGAFEAIRLANESGYWVFVVTNQSGVARGLYTEDDVRALHAWMEGEAANHGARIDAFRFCPHHPQAGEGSYKKDCDCRKPKPGMLEDLMREYGVDRARSLLIGDRDSDIQAAEAAEISGFLFPGGDLCAFLQPLLRFD